MRIFFLNLFLKSKKNLCKERYAPEIKSVFPFHIIAELEQPLALYPDQQTFKIGFGH
jgi:hypothetical protein